jgi:hypothetical protein
MKAERRGRQPLNSIEELLFDGTFLGSWDYLRVIEEGR